MYVVNYINSLNYYYYKIFTFQPLLDQSNKNAILSISSLIYRYCQINNMCAKEDIIISALKSIEQYLGDDCKFASQQAQNDMMLALKGLGNAGVAVSRKTLTNCYMVNQLNSNSNVKFSYLYTAHANSG